MVNYRLSKEAFVIEDFQNAKTFASFLPAVAGEDGKPLWAFYANVGQGMGGFGATSKETPITPFDSANLAYSNIPIKGFRTFLKGDEGYITPFFGKSESRRTMITTMSDFSIIEEGQGYKMEVLYSSIPHRPYSGLIRKVTYTNLSKSNVRFEAIDGLPVFFPKGLSNFSYKELVSLMAAYCEVSGFQTKKPFVKFKTSTGDNSIVKASIDGNGFFAKDQDGTLLSPIVDPATVFGHDASLLSSRFENESLADLLSEEEQIENKLPCAFYAFGKTLAPGQSYTVYAIYGSFDDEEAFAQAEKELTPKAIEAAIKDSSDLIQKLVSPSFCSTGDPLFDQYLRQSYLDNGLRGGFPTKMGDEKNPEVYYVYGRKHGDMERDYNAFVIPSRYYSSGPGNFRDVNQNRRNDLFFFPFVGSYNIELFFSLIQVDGQNPLNVAPEKFVADEEKAQSYCQGFPPAQKNDLIALLKGYYPSDAYTLFLDKWKLSKEEAKKRLDEIVSFSKQEKEANFSEGYWTDHWTYNVDLLENFSSIFPDKEKSLFFETKYGYFYSPVYVLPRSEKYSLLPTNEVRQYGAIDLQALKEKCEKTGFDIKKTAWLKDPSGKKIETNLASKIINLALIKFSTLDSLQMGIEMECEKPGWNDAMNGVPGLFGSGLSESVELLRLVRYSISHLSSYPDSSIDFLPKQHELFEGIKTLLPLLLSGQKERFAYWDEITSLRESLRYAYRDTAEGTMVEEKLSDVLPLFSLMEKTLSSGLKRALELGKGILPSYLLYRVKDYAKTGHINHLGYPTVKVKSFTVMTIPPFLEASARALKLADGTIGEKEIKAIKESDLYDKKFHFYKTSAALDEAPFEIGRVHAFTKGWLERECNFLHMDYKYLLGLLEAGYYKEFFQEEKTSWVFHYSPEVYGRNPTEAVSFVVPSCNPDKSKWGQGFFARLTGANAEFLDMYVRLFAGSKLFSMEDGKLSFSLDPKLPASAFDKEGKITFLLFGKTRVIYHNPLLLDCYEGVYLTYEYDGKTTNAIVGKDALRIRNGEIPQIDVRIQK